MRNGTAMFPADPDRPTGPRPLQYIGGRPVIEPAAQSRLRADLHWAEVARQMKADTLTNRAIVQAYLHTVLAEDNEARLRASLIAAAAFLASWADALGPGRVATIPPPVPAPR